MPAGLGAEHMGQASLGPSLVYGPRFGPGKGLWHWPPLHGTPWDSNTDHSYQTRFPVRALASESICVPPKGVCVCVQGGRASSWVFAQTHPSLFQVRQQLSEMKSHVEDGDVAGSPATPPDAPPAEQDPVEVRAVSRSPDVCY